MLRIAAVIGTGLIGTSVALALTGRGVTVHLLDRDPAAARTAAAMGAGITDEPSCPVDLAVLAVPPAGVGRVLAEMQRRGLAHHYTDVASVKERPLAEAAAAGCDLSTYAGGHPLAGLERSGPAAARADLFRDKPWVLTPSPRTTRATLARALRLVQLCGARPVMMRQDEHDRAVALISHTPHLVASLMAARLEHAPESAVRLSGQGVRDVTRVAAGNPDLWNDILGTNASAVSEVLVELADDLLVTARALAGFTVGRSGDEGERATAGLRDVLVRGRAGRARIPAPRQVPAARSAVSVLVGDHPDVLARLLSDMGGTRVAVEGLALDPGVDRAMGVVDLMVDPGAAEDLVDELCSLGWPALCSPGRPAADGTVSNGA
ncbi:prephenate dehydrogenase [Streptomyces sp. NPDC003011]